MVFDSKTLCNLDKQLTNQKRVVTNALDSYVTLLTHINPILSMEPDNAQCLSLKSDCKKILTQEIIVLNDAYESVRPFLKTNQPELHVTINYDAMMHSKFSPISSGEYQLTIFTAFSSFDFLYNSYFRIINNLSSSHPLSLKVSDIDALTFKKSEKITDNIFASIDNSYILSNFPNLYLSRSSYGVNSMPFQKFAVCSNYAINRPDAYNFAMGCLKDMKDKLCDLGYMPPIYHFKLDGYKLPEESKK
ncbi:MAG: hypothetical protein ACP5N1_07270 [Candidatus Woesearchaeota archaeon]